MNKVESKFSTVHIPDTKIVVEKIGLIQERITRLFQDFEQLREEVASLEEEAGVAGGEGDLTEDRQQTAVAVLVPAMEWISATEAHDRAAAEFNVEIPLRWISKNKGKFLSQPAPRSSGSRLSVEYLTLVRAFKSHQQTKCCKQAGTEVDEPAEGAFFQQIEALKAKTRAERR